MKLKTIQRLACLWAVFNLIVILTGCGDWISQAGSIINVLIPAINAAAALLLAFGVGLAPEVAAQIQKWGQEAQATLEQVVRPLLEELKTAIDSAKPDIMSKIQAAIQTIADDLKNILPAIHVTNPATQQKVVAMFELILAQFVALVNVIPVFQNKVSGHRAQAKLVHAVMEPDEFKREFNQLAQEFGPSYTVK